MPPRDDEEASGDEEYDSRELGAVEPDGGLPDGGLLYTADLTDAELARRWKEERDSLGSVSVGFAEAGRVLNGVPMPNGSAWTVVVPESSWGTQETVDALAMAATAVRAQFPTVLPLRINHIGKPQGGWLRPHRSHQSGRDVDLGFYYRPGQSATSFRGKREEALDAAACWALLKALITRADVEVILVDRRVQAVLKAWALSQGEDPAWVASLFDAGTASLFQHVRRHRDHFHVRLFNPRAQELGRRVQALLATEKDGNVAIHRVVRGDTLGGIAHRYGSTVKTIQRANGLKSTALSLGHTLQVPMLGPCTQCPLPPPLVLPPRRLPPARVAAVALDGGTGGDDGVQPSEAPLGVTR